MSNLEQLKKQALGLSLQEREQFVLAMWESLDGVATVDPEDWEIASVRDKDIETGAVKTLSHAEFLRRTSRG